MATDIEGRQPLGTPFGNPLQGVNVSQQPVDLGGGFEDPMDPCTMCQQGQMEIQQAYNDLTQTCNACQTQQNLKTLTSQGCQGCQQAQQVIQNVQQQSGGCTSCGGQQPMLQQMMTPSSQLSMQPMLTAQLGMVSSQQPMLTSSLNLPQQTYQGLVQPMLTPLTGTNQQILQTVIPQPGMMAGQLPIAIERGATSQITPQNILTTTSSGGMRTMQPMVVGGMMTIPSQPMQPVVMTNIPQPQPMMVQQPAPVNIIPQPPPLAPVQPVMQPTPLPQPAPVMQPAPVVQPAPPPPPPPVAPAPQQGTISGETVNLTPAQIAAAQQYVAGLQGPGGIGSIGITGVGAGATGYGAGGGKAGPGSGTTIGVGPEGITYNFGAGFVVGPGGIGFAGAPGAFDTHRPDLHAGGGWHMPLPLGTEGLLNLY